MVLYLCIASVLFISLFVSITDCRSNDELMAQRNGCLNKSTYNFLFICLIFTFWFLTAFRGSRIGNDTIHYLHYYEQIAKSGVDTALHIELGYQYLCLFLSKFNPDPSFILIVSSTICYGVCGIYIYKRSNNILYSAILLFCVAFSFFASGIRQAIAMAIVVVAYSKIKDGKKVFPIILIILASFIHTSALIAFLWFAHKFISKKPMIVIPTAIVVSILAAIGSLNSVLMNILEKYQTYFETESAGAGWLGIAYYALRAMVIYLFIYKFSEESENTHSLATCNAILLLITVCLGFSLSLFSRASLYFLLLAVVDVPNCFNSGKVKDRDLWMILAGTVMISYFILTLIVRPEWNNLYPYEFYWN